VSQALVQQIRDKIHGEQPITPEEALEMFDLEDPDIYDVFALANRVRHQYKGRDITLCSIVNAKSNLCGEDCAFCTQSSRSEADIQSYPLLNKDSLLRHAAEAEAGGASEFSIVTSGKGIRNKQEMAVIRETLQSLKENSGMLRCASLGVLSREALVQLRESGLQHFHHNLETSRRFYEHICTTRTFDSNLETVRIAKELGFDVCCGGILGMGETREDRVDLAITLRELDINSIPINFLNPGEGTPLAGAQFLTPMECLKCIAVYRLLLPTKSIMVMGGREVNLRDLQTMMFFAGANGALLGNYLTTTGREREDDIQLIRDLDLTTVQSHGSAPAADGTTNTAPCSCH
jgi:biotin synthase